MERSSRKRDIRFFLYIAIVFFAYFAVIGGLFWGGPEPAIAEEATSGGTADERLEALDQKVKILERKWEIAEEKSVTTAKDAPVLWADTGGFYLKSADGNFQLKIGGYIQADGRFFIDDKAKPLPDTFLLRRVRPVFEGTVSKFIDFRIIPDFGGGKTELQDAYLDLAYFPKARLRVGKFKSPVGLERLQSGTSIVFVERAYPTSLAPNRDVGLDLHGDLFDGVFSYDAGIFNGVADGGSADSDSDVKKDIAGRIFIHPFKKTEVEALQGLGLGVAASSGERKGTQTATLLPSFKTPGQNTFFSYRSAVAATATTPAVPAVVADGENSRILPQGYYYWGPFGLLGEYVISSQEVSKGNSGEKLENSAWQVAASYVLTGEKASYKGVKPKRPFENGKEGWGAFEVAARYSILKIDEAAFPDFADPKNSAEEARTWSIGFNWHLNRNTKIVGDYEQTTFKGGASNGDREDEKVFMTRFQVVY